MVKTECFLELCLTPFLRYSARVRDSRVPPLRPRAPQECVRLHTINRATGRARIWEVGLTFSSQLTANVFDTDGALRYVYAPFVSQFHGGCPLINPLPSPAPHAFSPMSFRWVARCGHVGGRQPQSDQRQLDPAAQRNRRNDGLRHRPLVARPGQFFFSLSLSPPREYEARASGYPGLVVN